jgi:endoglucanase
VQTLKAAQTVTTNGITTTRTWNPNGTIQSIHYAGITGQAYTDYTVVYGANNKPTSTTWMNGTTVVETAGWNASNQYVVHFYGITNQPYTDYSIVYDATGKAASEAFSNGMTENLTYNSDGSLHEIVTNGIMGQNYTSTDILYGWSSKGAVPVSEVFSNGLTQTWTYISSSTIKVDVVTLNGLSQANSTVTVFDGTTQLGTATTSSTGAWSYTTGHLTSGPHALSAKTAAAGVNTNAVAAALNVTIVTAPPVLTPIADEIYQATGSSGAVATFAATATDLVDGTAAVVFQEGNTIVHSGDTFSLGTHTIAASATDSRGNTSSETFTITVQDTTAPMVSGVAASPAVGDENAGKTIVLTLALSEIVNVAGAPTLTLNDSGTASYVGGSGTNALTFSYTVAAGQNTSALAITAVNLPNSAAVTDIYGTAASLASALTAFSGLQIDTTAPDAPVIAVDTVSASTVTLNGTAEANSTVNVLDGSTMLGTAVTNAAGAWSYTTGALAGGSHGFTATATDLAGNTGTASQVFNVAINSSTGGAGATSALLGVDLIGAEFGAPGHNVYNKDYIYPTAAELDYFKAQGLDLIRLPFSWERMQPTLGGALDPTELGRLQAFLSEAQARGMQVVVDMHNFGRYNGQTIGSAAVPITAFQDFWTKLAGALQGYTNIYGYDIMNEPHDMGDPTIWPAAAQAAVNGIRTVDTSHAIVVEGDHWSSANVWQQYNANLHINDPSNNIIYSAHAYFDANHSGTYTQTYDQQGANPNIGAQVLAPFESWLVANHAKGYIGEFNAPNNDPRWLTVLDNFEKTLQQDGIDATYWAAGPWWSASNVSVEPINGQDKPQIADLVKNAEQGSTSANKPVITYNPDGSIHDIAYSGITGLQVFGESYTAYDAVYGVNGWVTSETFSNGVTEAFTYASNGPMTTAIYAGLAGQQVLGESYTSYEVFYGANGKVTSETYSNGISQSMTYASNGYISEAVTTGITGQAYTSTDTVYGTYGNALTETWRNGTTPVKVVTWNVDESLHEILTYDNGVTLTDTLYGPHGPVSETFSTGQTTNWTYNSNGTVHEIVSAGIVGRSYTSSDTVYNSAVSSQAVAQMLVFPAGGPVTVQGYLSQLTFTSSASGESVTTSDGQVFNFAKGANTLLVGSGSSENFVVADQSGSLAISGFVPNALSTTNHDTITFGASAFNSFSDLLNHTTQYGANAIITDLFGDTLTLQNVQKANLTAADFVLSPATSQSAALLAQYMASIAPTGSTGTSGVTTTPTSQSTSTLLAPAHA